jgi:hypothetical protein
MPGFFDKKAGLSLFQPARRNERSCGAIRVEPLNSRGTEARIIALVLNATYEPLSIVSVQRAIVLLLKEKAELIEAASERLHAETISYPVPLVIRLVYYVRSCDRCARAFAQQRAPAG